MIMSHLCWPGCGSGQWSWVTCADLAVARWWKCLLAWLTGQSQTHGRFLVVHTLKLTT